MVRAFWPARRLPRRLIVLTGVQSDREASRQRPLRYPRRLTSPQRVKWAVPATALCEEAVAVSNEVIKRWSEVGLGEVVGAISL